MYCFSGLKCFEFFNYKKTKAYLSCCNAGKRLVVPHGCVTVDQKVVCVPPKHPFLTIDGCASDWFIITTVH